MISASTLLVLHWQEPKSVRQSRSRSRSLQTIKVREEKSKKWATHNEREERGRERASDTLSFLQRTYSVANGKWERTDERTPDWVQI